MRVKRGVAAHAKHKKVLKLTKGYLGSYHKLIKRAKEAMWHAGDYSFKHRRRRASDYRSNWISTISAELTKYDMRYNEFMNKLAKANVKLNRKILAVLALDKPEVFKAVVEKVK